MTCVAFHRLISLLASTHLLFAGCLIVGNDDGFEILEGRRLFKYWLCKVSWQETVVLDCVKPSTQVIWIVSDHIQKESLKVHQFCVVWVISPGSDLNSAPRLSTEVFLDVINDDGLGQISSGNSAQILDIVLCGIGLRVSDLHSMLSVEPVSDGFCLV